MYMDQNQYGGTQTGMQLQMGMGMNPMMQGNMVNGVFYYVGQSASLPARIEGISDENLLTIR